MKELIEEINKNIKTYHNTVNDRFLETISIKAKLAWVHPEQRNKFEFLYNRFMGGLI